MPLGGLISIAILLPNILMLFMPPREVPAETGRKDSTYRVMQIIERIGQASALIIPFLYQFPPLREASVDALAVMALALVFYYSSWFRYASKGHRFILLYAPMLGVPLPLAISPVVYFAGAAMLLHSWPEAVAAALLAAGHLYISHSEWKRCTRLPYPAPFASRRSVR